VQLAELWIIMDDGRRGMMIVLTCSLPHICGEWGRGLVVPGDPGEVIVTLGRFIRLLSEGADVWL